MILAPTAKRLVVQGLVLALLLFLVWLVGKEEPSEVRFQLRVAGPEEIVFAWSRDACSPTDIPDAPARAFRDAAGRVHLIASHDTVRLMVGPNLDRLERDCKIVMQSHRDPDPARFDDREWISAVYTPDGKTVYALVHDEYQGHTRPGRCPSGEYHECWYNALTLAVSKDGGASFVHAEPPGHLVAAIPHPYRPGGGPAGVFSPTNIVRDPGDGYFYALFRTIPYRGRLRGTSIMRTDDLADPKSWRAWNGRRFEVRFTDPYRTRSNDRRKHVPVPLTGLRGVQVVSSLTYNTHRERYLVIGMGRRRDPATGDTESGLYYALSDDLLRWTPAEMLLAAELPRTHEAGDPDPIAYPSAVDPDSPSRNFETTDGRFYVYFTRYNRSRTGPGGRDRDLLRVPVEFVERR